VKPTHSGIVELVGPAKDDLIRKIEMARCRQAIETRARLQFVDRVDDVSRNFDAIFLHDYCEAYEEGLIGFAEHFVLPMGVRINSTIGE
jgi:hypothetical protein